MHQVRQAARRGRREQLARSTPTEFAAAWRQRDVLVAAAVGLVGAAGHGDGAARCDAAGCGLAASGDESLCGLAHRLARLAPPAAVTPARGVDLRAAVTALRLALTEAIGAVRACRQTAHPVGSCWFTVPPDTDGCGEVLQLAHEVS